MAQIEIADGLHNGLGQRRFALWREAGQGGADLPAVIGYRLNQQFGILARFQPGFAAAKNTQAGIDVIGQNTQFFIQRGASDVNFGPAVQGFGHIAGGVNDKLPRSQRGGRAGKVVDPRANGGQYQAAQQQRSDHTANQPAPFFRCSRHRRRGWGFHRRQGYVRGSIYSRGVG